ncbi:helix-hairpin-helix domain-containing protein [Algoriphagus sp. NBT04N3]|jgi:hypothetical protein|uniref:ComEA family DNA-binding protein n=1 Tax=Algoriphagus sp. NBT04N3 TaxID=2705473 RepID=UPI001C63652C|nr:helix-hairpin-helix domain-containing protein [Algoriphagus sp. NBT04N3]QYH38917.1 helix-hairpin-helix domain-containing protein [Algoriphagus sp. NBT04N3]
MRAFGFSIVLLSFILTNPVYGQAPPRANFNLDELIERLFPVQDDDLDYESIYEVLFQLYQNPIDINKADMETLQSTFLLNPLQINEFLQYRAEMGPFLSLYELQAIPGFDQATIESLLPFLTLNPSIKREKSFWKRVSEEEQAYLIFRTRRVWETRRGFTAPDTSSTGRISTRYLGDPNDIYLRWRIQHAKDFSMGMTLDKDPGEKFTWDPKTARYGFNFLSFHLTRYQVGKWKTISLGDFQASFGQGLVFGAGYSLGKGAETVPTVRRSSVGIIPYTAALEFGFFRGIGSTYNYKNWEFSFIGSFAPKDGRLAESLDSLNREEFRISSFNQSGLHRTPSELSTKNQFKELSLGGNIQLKVPSKRLNSGVNFLHTSFDNEWRRDPRPYNQFEFAGKSNQVGSVYLNYNWRNFFLFGETAYSSSGGNGSVLGFISSLSNRLDFSFLWRNYDRNFHSFYGNAFSENTRPINERGTYLGLEFRPNKVWKINAYYDLFKFPWLKYRVYAPSAGHEWLARITYRPTRTLTAFIQFREEQKDRNASDSGEPNLPYLVLPIKRSNGILSLEYQISKEVFIRSRILWSQVQMDGLKSKGFLILQDLKWDKNRWKFTARYSLFDTDDYDSRLFAFENNVLWTFSIPAFFGQGQRSYLVSEYTVNSQIRLYLRIARTSYTDRERIGSGLQTIEGSTLTESSFLIRYLFHR